MKGKIINGCIIVLSIVLLLCYLFFVDGVDSMVQVFSTANLWWLAAGAGCMILYWISEALILHTSVSCFDTRMKYRDTFKTTMIGQFFNCVTPSSTGGQPMQAYYMNRIGVGVGYATSALLIRFIVYQIGLTLYSVVVLLFKYQEFASEISGFKYLIIFGFVINTTVALMLLLVGFTKNFAKKIIRGLTKFLAKIHIVKNLDERLEQVDREVDSFHEGFLIIKQHKARIFGMLGLTILQLTFFFLIPVMIYFSFGLPLSGLFTMIAAGSCVQMASCFIPLPGAAGGAEVSFFMLFKLFFPSSQLGTAILLWRLLTFYFPILIGMYFSRNLFGRKIIRDPVPEPEKNSEL